MGNKNKSIWDMLTFALVILLSLPLLSIFVLFFSMGVILLFTLLVASIIITTSPFIAMYDPSINILLNGIPEKYIMYMGLSLLSVTVFFFLIFIQLFKKVIKGTVGLIRRHISMGGVTN